MSTLKPVTLITGASAGIGAALARVFAERGHATVLVARREAKLTALADALAAEGRERPQVMAIDLADTDSGDRIARELVGRGLEPEIVVNNAGFGLAGEAATLDRGRQLAMVDLNVRLVTDLSLRWTESLARHRGGVLNIASVASFFPGPGMAVYYATKAYVLSFSEALHYELAGRGIKVTAVCPGPVPTEFQALAGIAGDRLSPLLTRSSSRIARDAYDGLMAGRRVVVPGFANRIAALLPRFVPRALMLSIVGAYQRNVSGPTTGRVE